MVKIKPLHLLIYTIILSLNLTACTEHKHRADGTRYYYNQGTQDGFSDSMGSNVILKPQASKKSKRKIYRTRVAVGAYLFWYPSGASSAESTNYYVYTSPSSSVKGTWAVCKSKPAGEEEEEVTPEEFNQANPNAVIPEEEETDSASTQDDSEEGSDTNGESSEGGNPSTEGNMGDSSEGGDSGGSSDGGSSGDGGGSSDGGGDGGGGD